MKLDEWDCQLIQLAKQPKKTEAMDVVNIWAERCNLELKYISLNDINRHLLRLIFNLQLIANPYFFADFVLNMAATTTEAELTVKLVDFFSNIETRLLPGYEEWARKSSLQ
jgi:hypothetical protein